MSFQYLIDKIRSAEFEHTPFRHLHIKDFFSHHDFTNITQDSQVRIAPASTDEELFSTLFDSGYKIIDFPGCVSDRMVYLDWHRSRTSRRRSNHSACEGFGVALRLVEPRGGLMEGLVEFLNGEAFQAALAEKFSIMRDGVVYDAGLQKYLDGYEISPHPDIRKKALTFMVNINPNAQSEWENHHTHYLRLRERFRYIGSYWEENETADRCWLPWSWCETLKEQRDNNSIVVFAPDNQTIHGVKANYDHLAAQRTQLYGNFWFMDSQITSCPQWEDFVNGRQGSALNAVGQLRSCVPRQIKAFIRGLKTRPENVHGRRN